MTVKRRLFLSNLMMIIVPVLIAVLVGCACIAMVFRVVQNGTSYGLQSSGEFYWGSQAAVEAAEHCLMEQSTADSSTAREQKATLENLLDTGALRMQIYSNGELLYDYGKKCGADRKLVKAAEILNEPGAVATSESRSVYRAVENVDGTRYQVYVLGTREEGMGDNLKTILILSALILAAAIVIAVIVTNRILTKFVFRKIEGPLDTLAAGVAEIGSGNLEFRIDYDRTDEFRPVCDAFNDMAVRLKRSVDQTVKNEESRKELMAGISHDIRSPLTSIKAYVEGLLDGIAQTPEIQQRYLMTIKRKAEDIDRMVNQIFIFSKLELDEYPMELTKVRLDTELRSMIEEVRDEYASGGLEISEERMDAFEAEIDTEQFRRIIRNILDNSRKYKNADTGHLTVELYAKNGCCDLILSDDGPGVSDDALDKLFDVFYRTDPARKNPAGGSGLGLAIAANTIKRMGGSVHAEKSASGGLAVILTLPGTDAYGKHAQTAAQQQDE